MRFHGEIRDELKRDRRKTWHQGKGPRGRSPESFEHLQGNTRVLLLAGEEMDSFQQLPRADIGLHKSDRNYVRLFQPSREDTGLGKDIRALLKIRQDDHIRFIEDASGQYYIAVDETEDAVSTRANRSKLIVRVTDPSLIERIIAVDPKRRL